MNLTAAVQGGVVGARLERLSSTVPEAVPAGGQPGLFAAPENPALPEALFTLPLYRRIGRKGLRFLRPALLPFLHRLQMRISTGVDTSMMSGAVARMAGTQESVLQSLAAQQAFMTALLQRMAEQQALTTTLRVTQDALLHRTTEQQAFMTTLQAAQDALQLKLAEQQAGVEALRESMAQLGAQAQAALDALANIARNTGDTVPLAAAAAKYAGLALQSRAVPLGDAMLTRTSFGWLLIPADDLHLLVAMLETGGTLEPGTTGVLQALLEPGDSAVDVGANVGTHSLAMAHAVGPTGRILAVEPTPRTAGLLRRTVVLAALEQVIRVEECAAGAAEGTARFFIGITSGHNSLLPLDEARSSMEVRVRPLDALLADDAPPAVVKIDAEGAEMEVWRGMADTIARAPDMAIVVEFGPAHLARSGISIEDWLATLTGPGFTVWEIDEASGAIHPLRLDRLRQVFSQNLLLLRAPPSRWPRLRVAA